MKLSDIPTGSAVFVDANIPLTSIFEEKRADLAEEFLLQVESRQFVAVTSSVVLGEVFHRLLLAEACKILQVPSHVALRRLKQEPDLFQKLGECWKLINEFLDLPLTVYPVDRGIFVEALSFARKYHLLVNDATHVALMARHGIQFLATFDHDLQHVDFITCCSED